MASDHNDMGIELFFEFVVFLFFIDFVDSRFRPRINVIFGTLTNYFKIFREISQLIFLKTLTEQFFTTFRRYFPTPNCSYT